jgi:small-conductance mechanosensitive channel
MAPEPPDEKRPSQNSGTDTDKTYYGAEHDDAQTAGQMTPTHADGHDDNIILEKQAPLERQPTHDSDFASHDAAAARAAGMSELRQPSFRASEEREHASRLNDDLELIRAERFVSNQASNAMGRSRSRQPPGESAVAAAGDAFNEMVPEVPAAATKNTDAVLYRFWMWLKKVPRFFRYLLYMLPGAAVLLAPVLLGHFSVVGDKAAVGGRYGPELTWFGIWLEIVWCTLWATRMIASIMPHLFQGVARVVGSINPRKWHDIGRQMELHVSLFTWWLAILVSYNPIMDDHRAEYDDDGKPVYINWIEVINKVIIAIFVLAALNFAEKILLQWIAMSFHQRTYATRIQNHKADTENLIRLYEHATSHLARADSAWNATTSTTPPSGSRTPMRALQETARTVIYKAGGVAKGIGNDFVGRRTVSKNHPPRVVAELLRSTASAHTLARLIYRSLVREGRDTVYLEDMALAFGGEDEAAAAERAEVAFIMFDKDLNGDISMEEFEIVCNEVQLEKKAIAASLKDLDSVVQKLDKVFLFVIVVIAIVVFVSIISASAAAGLASASTSILALSWVLQATAQEFLQSIIFVFIKHPFDVGDRVTVYGNTGASLKGDDYYVVEISLLYTEFKKMEGHIVQAPNSLLNTLFILNQRRSNGLADPVELRMRFGTPVWMVEELKARMLAFCMANKRDFQARIITEICALEDLRASRVNVVFFHKSNFQNELLRLVRHNKFLAELQKQVVDIGIEGPHRGDPGGSRESPSWLTSIVPNPPAYATVYPNPYGTTPVVEPPAEVPVTALAVPAPEPTDAAHDPTDAAASTTLHHAPSTSHRPRSHSRASAVGNAPHNMQPIVEERMADFQDVFEGRRDITRFASVRDRFGPSGGGLGASLSVVASNTSEVSPLGSTTGLQRAGTMHSTVERTGSRRFFGRPRSRTHVADGDAV